MLVMGLLADGHVLLDDLPGVAKTLMARSFATATGLSFCRIQFTPDLLPSDITGGATLLDQRTQTFTFRHGPLFANLVLADEVNSCPGQDAGRSARGDARAAGDRGRNDPSTRTAVSS